MSTPEFTWEPDYSWETRHARRVNITTFENGTEQRADRGPSPREWALKFTRLNSEISEIEAFWNARKGPLEAFTWTPPGSTEVVTVRFKDDNVKISRSGLRYGTIELTLREIL